MPVRISAIFLLIALAGGLCLCQTPAIPEEPKFLDPDRTEPAGTEYRTFYSKAIRGEASYLVYLPPDYKTSGRKRYPVVYWLHGLTGNQRTGGNFVAALDAAIKAGRSPAMVAILVNGLRDSRYYDSYDGKRPVETVFVKELIPHVDQTYRTQVKREFRAVEGFSMGGFGAAHCGFKYPELFGAVSIMSGALLDDESVATTKSDLYLKNFGANMEYFHEGSPWVVVRRNADKIRGRTFVRIVVGDRDGLLERDRKYHELLDSLNIAHEFSTVPGVAHEYAKFYEVLGGAGFEFYQRAFRMPEPGR